MEAVFYIIVIIFWIGVCAVVATIGKERKIGYAAVFWISFFLSPILGALIALGSEKGVPQVTNNYEAQRLLKIAIESGKSKKYEEAISYLKQAVVAQPKLSIAHYNLACFYSILHKKEEAFNALSAAVENGYNQIERIQSDSDLAFLRSQPEFAEFATSGYIKKISSEISFETLDKLEKLASLKEKGVLSDSEFEEQKRKLLGNK